MKDFPLTYGRVPATPRFAVPPLIVPEPEPPADTAATTSGFEEGFTAYKRGDYPTAFGQFMPLAVAGNSWAQMYLGMMYVDVKNYVEAARWFQRAGDQGIALAQFSLGMMYYEGKGVSQNYLEAARWLQRAANQGFGPAQAVVGAMYARAQGVPQDYVQAYMWLNLAAVGETYGAEMREIDAAVAETRDIVAARLSPAQRAQAEEMARNWRPESQPGPNVASPPPTVTDEDVVGKSAVVADVQAELAALGYGPGPADGVMGARTRAAIRAFQTDAGLPVDGQISDQLIAALSNAGADGGSAPALTAAADPGGEGTGAKPWERYAEQGRLKGTGTGFAVSQDGQIVTNHHVVADCAEVRVRPGGREALAGAVLAQDPGNDLALLRVPVHLAAAALRDAPGIRAGDSVVAVGFPLPGLLGSEANVTTGTVSALAGIGNDARFLQMTVPVQPGNSGGPLLDLEGRVVGVVVGKLDALEVASVTGDIPLEAGVSRTA